MPSISKAVKAVTLILLLSACASTIPQIPEKYMLDEHLKKVNVIQKFRMGLGRQPTFVIFNRTESQYTPYQRHSERPGFWMPIVWGVLIFCLGLFIIRLIVYIFKQMKAKEFSPLSCTVEVKIAALFACRYSFHVISLLFHDFL